MKKLTTLAGAAVLSLASALMIAPQAEGETLYPKPTVLPFYEMSLPKVHAFQLEAPHPAWGIRRVARQINQNVEGVHIYRWGTCADRPTLPCIKVEIDDYGTYEETGVDWFGIYGAAFGNQGGLIQLNASYIPERNGKLSNIACHELGHALGMRHHLAWGCDGYGLPTSFTPRELRAFQNFYGKE